MQKHEFERMAKIEVTDEVYETVIQPMYLATDLSKAEFIKVLNLRALAAQKPKKEKVIKAMLIRDRSWNFTTPNGCYYHIKRMELVDVDIRTGKFIVKPLEDEDLQKLRSEGKDLHYGYHFDFDYTRCADTGHNEIRLAM